ncbi:hypothetical protein KUA25_04645 [Bacteroidales bacterium MSK.15.36]|nr:hypothetical protein [Bacteroidales bacterium MSK.15.36]
MNEDCKDCIYIKNVEDRITKVENAVEILQRDVTDTKLNFAASNTQMKSIAVSLEKLEKKIDNISNKVDSLEKKPGKRWDDLTKTIITVIATAAVTYFISK